VVEATLKLHPKPAATRMLRALYRDVESAAEAVARLMAQPETPSMLEFMDATAIRLARDIGGADIPDAGALLMIEGDGDPARLDALMQALATHAGGEGCLDITIPGSSEEQAQLMAARRALSPALRSLASGKINEDVVVPVSRVPELVRFVEQLSRDSGLLIVCFGHIGNGNVHVNVMYDKAEATQTAIAESCAEKLFTEVLRLGGMLSGEHGIGLAKRGFMAQAFSPETLAMMRGIKTLFDPDGILNPGKTLPDVTAGASGEDPK
jgi:D-lactate dehydrogenase